jgi:hypothetical protein
VIGVPGLSNCAILKSGALDCWGYNGDSALGNGSSNLFSNVPTKVVGIGGKGALTHVVNLVTSDASVCALVAGGLYCWGMASFGYSPSPKAVKGFGGSGVLKGVRSAAGDEDGSNCVVLTSGDAECWGANIVGQLGDGTTVGSYVPQEVVGAG